ncbi:hypothetical protein Aph01nite_00160 [Acrocarpospora phusangensis]|uniref:STAS domain-containing protein n=1 Tax=Acrocarpospora phusangensis TaxID=1070424 RepID=A0A919UHM9_9ACTN|nr:STAS domain-containing protein [Acrocarpospora phusangensis]GIH21706.1 hypothetical protein Aph01nite_00160 [Acrocarpospora phusangensis]
MTTNGRPAAVDTAAEGHADVRLLYSDAILSITLIETSHSTLAQLTGEIDISNSTPVQAALTYAKGRALPLVIDVADVTFVDVAGARALIEFTRQGQVPPVDVRNISSRMRFLLDMLQ